MAKKYYWIKLQTDFFKRHDIKIVEAMPNGKDYVLFYLKLILEAASHDGNLRFSDTIPYTETMLSTITNTNIDVVRSAVEVFKELGMMEILEDKTIFLTECQKMLGSETDWAKKKREYREKQRTLSLECPHDVRQEIEKEIDIDIDKEREDIYINNIYKGDEKKTPHSHRNSYGEFNHVYLSDEEVEKLYSTYGNAKSNEAITILDEYIEKTGKKYENCYLAIKDWCFKAIEERKPKHDKKHGFKQRDDTDYADLERRLTEI